MTWKIQARFQHRGEAVAAESAQLEVKRENPDRVVRFQPAGTARNPVTLRNSPREDGRRWASQRNDDGYQSKVVEIAYEGDEYVVLFLGTKRDHAGDDDTEVFVATSGGGDQEPDG